MTASEKKYCEELKDYRGINNCDYNQLLKNKKAAIKYLFSISESKEVIVSKMNWVELEGFCFTGVGLETLGELIPLEKAKLKFLGLGR